MRMRLSEPMLHCYQMCIWTFGLQIRQTTYTSLIPDLRALAPQWEHLPVHRWPQQRPPSASTAYLARSSKNRAQKIDSALARSMF